MNVFPQFLIKSSHATNALLTYTLCFSQCQHSTLKYFVFQSIKCRVCLGVFFLVYLNNRNGSLVPITTALLIQIILKTEYSIH